MGAKNPSRVGGAFERECAKELSLWLTDQTDKTQLIRSVSSGGWTHRKTNQVGDLAPNGPAGRVFRERVGVECKKRQEFSWEHVFSRESPALAEWWLKHYNECTPANLVPMLIWRKNRQKVLAGFDPQHINLGMLPTSTPTVRITWHNYPEIVLFPLATMFQTLTPPEFYQRFLLR